MMARIRAQKCLRHTSLSLSGPMVKLCDAMPACARDFPGGAAAAYDALAARVNEAPVEVAYPMADGTTATRLLTSGLLETNAFYALYSPEGRAEFLRTLAAARQGNLVPILQLGYVNTYIDPETEAQSIHGVVWANVNRQWSGGMGDLHRLRDRVQRFCLRGLGVPAETIDSALAAASRAELLNNNS